MILVVSYAIIFILLANSVSGCFQSIVSFGDSLADTGNLLLRSNPPHSTLPPYGRTFFHRPTGRFSDGRLVIDFIAQSLGLPLVEPYAGRRYDGGRRNFGKGVNFAVAGASALDNSVYEKIGLFNADTNVSLGVQLDLLKHFLATLPDGRTFLQRSLVLVGEIGGNDYSHMINQGVSLETIQVYMPLVVAYIGSIIEELIKLGAETMLVPGNVPIGCFPAYLTIFKASSTTKDYDPKTGCLNWLNEISSYHNELLQKELSRIQKLNPAHVSIVYADNYNAIVRFYLSPKEFGFKEGSILEACCGVSGQPYNYNASTPCAIAPSTSCEDPSTFASWDGLHYTEAANRLIAQGLLQGGPYTIPHIQTICPSVSWVDQVNQF